MVSERDSCVRETVSEAKKIKKREPSANRTARVTGRHSFSLSAAKSKGGNLKRHPYFFEAKVAVPHRGARPEPYGSAGEKSSSRSALRYFFLPSLDPFRRENGCKAYKETRVPAPQAGCLTDKIKGYGNKRRERIQRMV